MLSVALSDAALQPIPAMFQLEGTFAEGDAKVCASGKVDDTSGFSATLCSEPDGSGHKHTATFSRELSVGEFGPVVASGTWDPSTGLLCLAADLKLDVDGLKSPQVQAKQCFEKDGSGVKASGPVTIAGTASHDQVGQMSLVGAFDKDGPNGKPQLCVTGQVLSGKAPWLPLKGVTILGVHAKTCHEKGGFSDLSVGATFRVGKEGAPASITLTAMGSLAKSGGACVTGAADEKSCDNLERMWRKQLEDPRDGVDGRYRWLGGACVDALLDEKACGDASGKWQHETTMALQLASSAFCQAKGASTCGWKAHCDETVGDKPCEQVWKPISGVSKAPASLQALGLSALQGRVLVHGGEATLEGRGKVTFGGNSVTLVPKPGGGDLLTLSELGLAGRLATDGSFAFGVQGQGGLDFGAIKADLWASSEVTDEGAVFDGVVLPKCSGAGATKSCTFPTWQPFKDLAGDGALAIASKGARAGFRVNWSGAAASSPYTFEALLQTGAEVSLLGNAKLSTDLVLLGAWPKSGAGEGGAKPVLAALGQLSKFSVKAGAHTITLGQPKPGGGATIQPILLMASTEKLEDLQLDPALLAEESKAQWSDAIEVPKGLTVRSGAELGPVKHLFESAYAQLDVNIAGATKFGVRGVIGAQWDLIKPEMGVPGIYDAGFKQIEAKIDVDGTTVFVAVGGKATFTPRNKDGKPHPEKLEASGFFEVDSTASVGGTLALKGLWTEPFWLPNVAIMDLGISMKLQVAVPPYPTAYGFTGNGLLLKDKLYAPWPKIARDKQNNPVGVNPDGSLMSKLPDKVLSVGQSFYFDQAPSTSGFCAGPACAVTPPLLLRIDRQNISTQDAIDAANLAIGFVRNLREAAMAPDSPLKVIDPTSGKFVSAGKYFEPIGKHLPLKAGLPTLDVSPFEAKLKRGLVYLSTHDQNRFDIDWPFGLRLKLDAAMTLPKTLPGNVAVPDGGKEKIVKLDGFVDASGMDLAGRISPLNIHDKLVFAANPYRRFAQLSGGKVLIGHGGSAHQWQTFEARIKDDTLGAGSKGAVILRRMSDGKGVEIVADELAAPCDKDAEGVDGKLEGCEELRARVRVKIHDPGQAKHPVRVLATKHGVLKKGSWAHLAVVSRKGRISVLIDGSTVVTTDTADGPDGKAGTNDDLPPTELVLTGSSTTLGEGLDAIDDVRFWATPRTSAELARGMTGLAKGYHTDEALLARYSFDFDDNATTALGSVVAHDEKLPKQGKAAHGALLSGAKIAVDPTDQDLFFQLSLPLTNPTAAGIWLRGGMSLSLPGPLAKVLGQDVLATAASVHFGKGKVAATLYARELPVLPIPGVGRFVLSGDGPNGVAGDFDDGLYFAVDALGQPAPSIDVSALFAFDEQQSDKSKRHAIASAVLRAGCLKKHDNPGKKGLDAWDAVFTTGCSSLADLHVHALAKAGDKGSLTIPTGVTGQGDLAINGSSPAGSR